MENSPPTSRFSQPSCTKFSAKNGREVVVITCKPSDKETEWQEIPRLKRERKNLTLGPEGTIALTLMNKSPMALHRKHTSRIEHEISSTRSSIPSPSRRRNYSKSPYKQHIADEDTLSPITGLDTQRNVSLLPIPDLGRNASPYKSEREKHNWVINRNHNQRIPSRENREAHSGVLEVNSVSQKPNYRTSVTAPRSRGREKDQQSNYGKTLQEEEKTTSPLPKGLLQKQREASHLKVPSIGEINEMVALAKLSKNPNGDNTLTGCTESILPGDIFFSRQTQKTSLPNSTIIPQRGTPTYQKDRGNGNLNMNIRGTSSSNGLSRLTAVSWSAVTSRKGTGTLSASSSMKSDTKRKTSAGTRITANRKKSQTEAWFACMREGSCKTSKKSPEHGTIDEAFFIERAFVVESLPQFWADKYQPASVNDFICHKQEAQLLKELVSKDACPHILLKDPSGSGKRALAMALLREIYGDECRNLSHNLRHFPIQERRPMQVIVPITSSSHHLELNVNLEPNAKYALMGLVKEIRSIYAITPDESNNNFKSDYKVIVLYEVDKAAQSIQHLIKRIIDGYSDICKLVLCCEEDIDILEPVKNQFKVIKVDAPLTHEIVEVLIQISKKEDIDLSINFAAKIATKSNQNLRKAIMALQACKAHKCPFLEEQPIPVGWEEIVIEIASEILADPSNSCLFSIKEKFQKLLEDFVHPKQILQKLVEELLKRIEASLKRELYYWHAYYDKRLPSGTTALLKLEEFVAKFMSIYRKSSASGQYV